MIIPELSCDLLPIAITKLPHVISFLYIFFMSTLDEPCAHFKNQILHKKYYNFENLMSLVKRFQFSQYNYVFHNAM